MNTTSSKQKLQKEKTDHEKQKKKQIFGQIKIQVY